MPGGPPGGRLPDGTAGLVGGRPPAGRPRVHAGPRPAGGRPPGGTAPPGGGAAGRPSGPRPGPARAETPPRDRATHRMAASLQIRRLHGRQHSFDKGRDGGETAAVATARRERQPRGSREPGRAGLHRRGQRGADSATPRRVRRRIPAAAARARAGRAGLRGPAEALGGFVAGQPFEVADAERGAVVLGQPLQFLVEDGADLPPAEVVQVARATALPAAARPSGGGRGRPAACATPAATRAAAEAQLWRVADVRGGAQRPPNVRLPGVVGVVLAGQQPAASRTGSWAVCRATRAANASSSRPARKRSSSARWSAHRRVPPPGRGRGGETSRSVVGHAAPAVRQVVPPAGTGGTVFFPRQDNGSQGRTIWS